MNPNHSKTKKEKELADNARLLRAWKKFHCDELAEALAGLHRDVMTRLTSHLKQLRSARELVEFIEAKDWSAVDTRTRLVALHEINSAICELREKQGLPPIDDALPGEPLRAYQVIVAVNVDRYVIYWKPDGTGPDRRKSFYLKPGQKFPDIDQMNADTPKDQWRESFGKDVGPWQAQYIVRLLHPVSMKRYSFPTSTDGGHAAVRELRQRTKDMRQVRGEHVYALVRLRDTFMPTAYGGRQRPYFDIVRFVTFGDDGAVKSSALASSDAPSLAGPSTPSTVSDSVQMRTVEPPTAKEVTQDEIMF